MSKPAGNSKVSTRIATIEQAADIAGCSQRTIGRDTDQVEALLPADPRYRDFLMKGHERFMTTVEVAELLRMPVESVRWWRHVGKGPKSFKLGRRVLYAREDLEAFIEQARLEQAPAEPERPNWTRRP
jgi:predicted DNA-binding transcriptional regulator AlpA